MTVGWSQDERRVVTFGRLYLHTVLQPGISRLLQHLGKYAVRRPHRHCGVEGIADISPYGPRVFQAKSTGFPERLTDENVVKRDDGFRGAHPPDTDLPTDSNAVDIDEGRRQASLTDASGSPPSTGYQGLTSDRQEIAKDRTGPLVVESQLDDCLWQ